MKRIKAYEVYVSKDYDAFTRLEGNRPITSGRKNKVKASIMKFGWIRNPLVCNEKLEIVDGQARFEACKELGLPIEYIIDEGIGIEECVSMNIYQANWTQKDYISCYSNRGNENYTELEKLLEKYKDIGSIATVFSATLVPRRSSEDIIKSGRLIFPHKNAIKADEALAYVRPLMPCIKQLSGRRTEFISMVIFVYLKSPDVDKRRLADVIKKKYKSFAPIASYENALREMEKAYNRGRFNGKLANFVNDYIEYKRNRKGNNGTD